MSANGLMRKMSVRLAMDDMQNDVFHDLGNNFFQTLIEENGDSVKVRPLKVPFFFLHLRSATKLSRRHSTGRESQ